MTAALRAEAPDDTSPSPAIHVWELIDAVAAYDLPGSIHELPAEPLPDGLWRRFLAAATRQRLVGMVAQAVADGHLPVTDAQLDALAERHRDAMALALRVERSAQWTVRLLRDVDVPVRILKGIAHAHLDYPAPELRPTGDVDLLVPSDGIDRTLATLTAAGAWRDAPELRPGFDRRFAKSVTMIAPDGANVLDVHRTFVMGPFGLTVQLSDLFADGQALAVGDCPMTALAAEQRLLHACYNVVIGERPPRSLSLRDVAQLVLNGSIDVDRVLRLARDWHGELVLAEGVREAWARLRLHDRTPLTGWADGYVAPRSHQWRLRASQSSRYGPRAWSSLPAIPGVRDKVAFAHAVALPRRDWLADRGEQRSGRLRRGWRSLRGAWT